MVDKITIFCLIRIITPCNDVDSEAAATQMVECGKLARSECRRDKTWSMRKQQPEPPCCCSSMGPNEETVWRIRKVANQNPIKIRLLVDAGSRCDNIRIERWPLGCQHLRRDTW